MTQSDSVVYVPRHVVRQTHPAARDKLIPRLAGLALAALLCIPAPAAQAQQQEGRISGTVLVEGAQRPLPGALVSVDGQAGKEATTDASGQFRLVGVTGSSVTVSV